MSIVCVPESKQVEINKVTISITVQHNHDDTMFMSFFKTAAVALVTHSSANSPLCNVTPFNDDFQALLAPFDILQDSVS